MDTIPDPSIRRLSAYLRQLERLAAEGVEHVSSKQLARRLKVGDAMVRRDLTLFGQFGRPGVGYDVNDLIRATREILGTSKRWKVIIVGAGSICNALLKYPAFPKRGFDIVAAFDNNPKKIGSKAYNVTTRGMEELQSYVGANRVRAAILTVPPAAAQEVCDQLVNAGIEGIINFSTERLDVPPGVHVSSVDITAQLEQLSFQLSHS